MPKKQRISHAEHELIARGGFMREKGRHFSLLHGSFPGSGHDLPSVACVVSRKTAARAVDRNFIKRRCRAIARELIKKITEPSVFVFHASKSSNKASFGEIKEDIENLMKKSLAKKVADKKTG